LARILRQSQSKDLRFAFAVASLAVIPAGNLLLCSHYSYTAFALNPADQRGLVGQGFSFDRIPGGIFH
jgi:hypothetical protein